MCCLWIWSLEIEIHTDWKVFRSWHIKKGHKSENSGGIHSSPGTAINFLGAEGIVPNDLNYFKECRKKT